MAFLLLKFFKNIKNNNWPEEHISRKSAGVVVNSQCFKWQTGAVSFGEKNKNKVYMYVLYSEPQPRSGCVRADPWKSTVSNLPPATHF